MNWGLSRNYLIFVVVFSILNIALVPCIVTDSQLIDSLEDNIHETVKLNVEIYRMEGVKTLSLNILEEDFFKVEDIFDDLRKKLDDSITRDETIELFNETMSVLKYYGLLPCNADIQETQHLVTSMLLDEQSELLFENLFNKDQEVFNVNHNYLCLIAGETNRTIIPGIFFTINYLTALTFAGLSYLCYVNGFSLIEDIFEILLITFFIPASLLFKMSTIFSSPMNIGGFISFGYRTSDPGQNNYYPSEGWVWTTGLNGNKNWNGTFVGNIWFINSLYPPQVTKYYIGAVGFTGIKIGNSLNRNTYFIGTSLQVGFDTDYPYP